LKKEATFSILFISANASLKINEVSLFGGEKIFMLTLVPSKSLSCSAKCPGEQPKQAEIRVVKMKTLRIFALKKKRILLMLFFPPLII